MTNIKNIDPSLLSIDQNHLKALIVLFSSLILFNSLQLIFNYVAAYIEKDNEDKYLIFASTDKNKAALENYTELWDEIKDQIELISGNKPIEYEKDFMKIKFESDDNLPLGKILNIPVCIITFRSVFQENNNYYPQVFLHECFYEYEYEFEDGSYVLV